MTVVQHGAVRRGAKTRPGFDSPSATPQRKDAHMRYLLTRFTTGFTLTIIAIWVTR